MRRRFVFAAGASVQVIAPKPIEEQVCPCGARLADHGWTGDDVLTCPPAPVEGQHA